MKEAVIVDAISKEIAAAEVALRVAECLFDAIDPKSPPDLIDAAIFGLEEAIKRRNGLFIKAKQDLGLPISTTERGEKLGF